jgi:hypothetical protein
MEEKRVVILVWGTGTFFGLLGIFLAYFLKNSLI